MDKSIIRQKEMLILSILKNSAEHILSGDIKLEPDDIIDVKLFIDNIMDARSNTILKIFFNKKSDRVIAINSFCLEKIKVMETFQCWSKLSFGKWSNTSFGDPILYTLLYYQLMDAPLYHIESFDKLAIADAFILRIFKELINKNVSSVEEVLVQLTLMGVSDLT